jgi:hypothetical protein
MDQVKIEKVRSFAVLCAALDSKCVQEDRDKPLCIVIESLKGCSILLSVLHKCVLKVINESCITQSLQSSQSEAIPAKGK